MKRGKLEQKIFEWRLYKLHCECVRRNPDYGRDYQSWRENVRRDSAWTLFINGRWMLLKSELPPDPADQPDLDGIMTLAPPHKGRTPKDDETDHLADKGLLAISMGPYLEPSNVPASAAGLVVLTYFHQNNPKKWERSAINMRLSKGSIMRSFETLVDIWIKERKESGLKQQQSTERVRLDAYIDYLKTYDWKKSGKSYREIGNILWPGWNTDTELKAKTYYGKARKLILNPPLLGKSPADYSGTFNAPMGPYRHSCRS